LLIIEVITADLKGPKPCCILAMKKRGELERQALAQRRKELAANLIDRQRSS